MCRPAQDETTMNKVVSQSMVIQVCQKSLFKPSVRFGFLQVHPHLATRSHSGQLRFERVVGTFQIRTCSSTSRRRRSIVSGPRCVSTWAQRRPTPTRASPRTKSVGPTWHSLCSTQRSHARTDSSSPQTSMSERCYIGLGHSRRAWRTQVFGIDDQR